MEADEGIRDAVRCVRYSAREPEQMAQNTSEGG